MPMSPGAGAIPERTSLRMDSSVLRVRVGNFHQPFLQGDGQVDQVGNPFWCRTSKSCSICSQLQMNLHHIKGVEISLTVEA